MKNTSQQYLNSEAHGYLMEAKACKLLLKDLERIRAKLKRHIEKEAADREAEFEAALQPFYMGHMCLYVTPECFDDPPKIPEVYNDATACVWRDGTWQLLEDTSEGFLLFVQSKSKEEAAA